jgi:hypothetical protein
VDGRALGGGDASGVSEGATRSASIPISAATAPRRSCRTSRNDRRSE